MKKILVISWFYPPINSSEGLVTYKLLRNSKFRYDVCMQESNASWSYGKNEKLPESENVTRIPVKADNLEVWKNAVIAYFREHRDEYDIVMTRSMPPESHMLGLKIKEIKPEITWIASFGDPIANNPFVLKDMVTKSPYSYAFHIMGVRGLVSPKRILKNMLWKKRTYDGLASFRQEQQLEKDILKISDYVIFNNPYQEEYMLHGYTEEVKNKAIVLPHSYDSTLYPLTGTNNKCDKIQMVYIGHLNDIRTPHLLFEAVCQLKMAYPDLAEKLEMRFYGNMSDKEKVYLLDNELLDVVKIMKPVNYQTSLEIMQHSDWLIHIDANLSGIVDNNIFFAAKLADYIGAGKPIFAITMFDGAGADVVRDVNGVIVSYTVDEIRNYLYLIVYKHYMLPCLDKSGKEKYNSVNVAKCFDEFIEKKVLQ